MDFREFFKSSTFTLFAHGDSNWDLYVQKYKDNLPHLVAIARQGSGATDSTYGGMDYLEQLERRGIAHGFTRVLQVNASRNERGII